ncbi:MAG: hypothetical protein [Bacteriophage sp.]|nr:MAG: hypothetical protein [Bacteriophage sp.]
MLDLSVFKEKTFELKLFDGEVLNLKRPSHRQVINMMAYEQTFKNKNNHKNVEKMVSTFSQMILDILNNNVEGKTFDQDYVEEYFDFNLGMTLVQAYMEFVQEINSDPN